MARGATSSATGIEPEQVAGERRHDVLHRCLASFHLARYPRRNALAGILAHGARPARARGASPGLRFWRLLGTGRGATMTLSADLRRWALFAVWEDDAALDAFLAESPVARALGASSGEEALARPAAARCVRTARGAERPAARPRRRRSTTRRAGRDPHPRDDPARAGCRLLRRDRAARRRPRWTPGPARLGRHRRVAGRAPGDVLALAHARDARDYAYSGADHRAVVAPHARASDWYAEELFARFRPYGSAGTWDGRDPLQPAGATVTPARSRAPRCARRAIDQRQPAAGVNGAADAAKARRTTAGTRWPGAGAAPPAGRAARRRRSRRRSAPVSRSSSRGRAARGLDHPLAHAEAVHHRRRRRRPSPRSRRSPAR